MVNDKFQNLAWKTNLDSLHINQGNFTAGFTTCSSKVKAFRRLRTFNGFELPTFTFFWQTNVFNQSPPILSMFNVLILQINITLKTTSILRTRINVEPEYKILTLSILSQKVNHILVPFIFLPFPQQPNGWSSLINKFNHPPCITIKRKEQNPNTQYAYETFHR